VTYYWKYNILVTPLLLVRAPLMLLAYALRWLTPKVEAAARAIPGWRR
jgi:hypothetical protein